MNFLIHLIVNINFLIRLGIALDHQGTIIDAAEILQNQVLVKSLPDRVQHIWFELLELHELIKGADDLEQQDRLLFFLLVPEK